MAKVNVPLIRFNQGLISPESLARVDDERTRLSAEVYDNWLPKTQGAMRIRPGTIYQGSTLNDTGAYLIEFVAAADEVALLELSTNKMRVWSGTDAHNLSLLSRPKVDTTLTIRDTGWSKSHTSGGITSNTTQSEGIGHIPLMDDYTTEGVTISASSEAPLGVYAFGGPAWKIGDGFYDAWYADTGAGDTGEQWVKVDFGAGVTKQVLRTFVYADITDNDRAPEDFVIEWSNDDAAWTQWAVAQTGQSFASGETKQYADTGFSDTGSPSARYWRLRTTKNGSANPQANFTAISEWRLFDSANAAGADTGQSSISAAGLRLNAGAQGAVARYRKRVAIDTGDQGLEHSINCRVSRGPVSLRVGSSELDDDIIEQTILRTGYHNLSFTPHVAAIFVTLQTSDQVNRTVSTFTIGDSGTVELETPWGANNIDNVRHDQSADVVFVNCRDVKQHMIERRGSDTGTNKGRSWSVVEYDSNLGPFSLPFNQDARLQVNALEGNCTISSDIAVFKPDQVGQLLRLTHSGQDAVDKLSKIDAVSTPTSVVGIQDTGKNDPDSDRILRIEISGNYTGGWEIERSFEAETFGFKNTPSDFITAGSTAGKDTTDTGTATMYIRDPADNEIVYYRVRMTSYSSGTMIVKTYNPTGIESGIYRITNYNTNQSVDVETIRACSDTGLTPDWEIGEWSESTGYPSAIAIHEGRLCHAGQASIYFSVSDDYTNFDDEVEGSSAPISRTLGAGPVADILHLTSSDILVAGTADSELSIRSSSFDEVITQTNTAARRISTLGGLNIRAVKRNKDVFFVNRSGKNLFRLVATTRAEDSEPLDLTLLAENVLEGGVAAIAIQREPDTRIHCVLNDGTVAILTYEPNEELLSWSKWSGDTGTAAFVERAAVLPASGEDAVFYIVRRTINGATKRFIERWSKESQSTGDSGISYLSDCSLLQTDTGVETEIAGIHHLVGCSVVAWGSDTGQDNAGKDYSPEVNLVPTEYTVDTGGSIVLGTAVHHAVVGLPYKANFKSTKLAYGATLGTALTQMKRIDELGLILYKTHNRGIKHGRDTGNLDLLPLYIDQGAQVDPDSIFAAKEIRHVVFPGAWDSDSRIVLQAQSPRPAQVLAAVPHIKTSEH